MGLLIIGAGVVGTATGEGFRRMGETVYFYDINPEKQKDLSMKNYNLVLKEGHIPEDVDVIFICVEEWNIDKVFQTWKDSFKDKIVVIRSTVPPGTCNSIKYRYGISVVHNPEFLREKTALNDFLYPDKIVIGRDHKMQDVVDPFFNDLYKPFNAPIIFTDTKTSEFLKLASNAILSSYISMWNQLKLIADKLGINSHQVAKILTLDPRISKYGTLHGEAFRGFCLPKDLKTLSKVAQDNNVNWTMLDAIRFINEIIEEKE